MTPGFPPIVPRTRRRFRAVSASVKLIRSIFALLPALVLSACGGGGGGGGSNVDALLSTVAVGVPFGAVADGVETVPVTVTVRDSSGDPLENRTVTLTLEGTGGSLVQPAVPTDATGVATGSLSATIAGLQRVTATVESVELNDRPTVDFVRLSANTFYVRTTGSDTNVGDRPNDAWATLGFALTQLVAGDTLYVGSGTYAESLTFSTSGTAADPIEIHGDPSGAFTGDAGEVLVDAGGAAFGLQLNGVSNVVVRGLTLTGARPAGAAGGGLYVNGGSDLYLFANEVRANDCGVQVVGATDVTLEANRVHSNDGTGGDGLLLDGTTNVELWNNVVYGNAGFGLHLLDAAVNTTVELNTFYQNVGDQIREDGSGSIGSVRHSLLSEGSAAGIRLVAGTTITESNNLMWMHAGPDVQIGTDPPAPPSGSANPQFLAPAGSDGMLGGVNAADDDFTVAAVSPALDAGAEDAERILLPFGGAVRGTSSLADGTLDGEDPDGDVVNLGAHLPAAVDAFSALDNGQARLMAHTEDDVRPRGLVRGTSGWQSATRGAPMNEDVRWLVHRTSPLASAEEFLAGLSDDGASTQLYLRHWDGRRWSEDHPLRRPVSAIASANAGQRGFDLEIEGVSGDALFVYSDDDENPRYRVFSNGGWSADQDVFTTPPSAGTVLWIELVQRPGTDEIALVCLDDTETLSALVWTGSAWSDAGVPFVLGTQVAELRDSRCFDAAFESQSGDLLVAWGFNTVIEETRYGSRTTAGTWTTGQHASTDAVGTVFRLAADPTSDRIAAAVGEGLAGADVAGMIWDGSDWDDVAGDLVLGGPTGQIDLGVAWVGTTGEAVVILDRDAGAGTLQWARWRFFAAGGWSNQADVSLSGLGDLVSVELRGVPGQDALKAFFVDDQGDLFALDYDGSQWSSDGASLVSGLDMDGASEPFDVSFRD